MLARPTPRKGARRRYALLLARVLVMLVAFLISGAVHAYAESLPNEAPACPEGERDDCDPEHDDDPWCLDDCLGPSHHCSCCANLMVVFPPDAKLAPDSVRDADAQPSMAIRADHGVSSRVERPPRR